MSPAVKRRGLWHTPLFILVCYVWTSGALAQAPQAEGIEAVAAVGRTNNLMHRQTTLVTRDVTPLARHLWTAKGHVVSPAVIPLPEGQLGFTAGILVRDPDGHAMQVIER